MSVDIHPERRLLHTREVSCRAYARPDGLYEIESALVDVKGDTVFVGDRDRIEPGEPFHEMRLRLVIDGDLNVRDVVAHTLHAPYRSCAGIAPAYASLIGLNLASGFMKRARALLGGTAGCTHLTELLGPTITTAMQTVWHIRDRLTEPVSQRPATTVAPGVAPPELDRCHALRLDGDVVRRHYPAFHRPEGDTHA